MLVVTDFVIMWLWPVRAKREDDFLHEGFGALIKGSFGCWYPRKWHRWWWRRRRRRYPVLSDVTSSSSWRTRLGQFRERRQVRDGAKNIDRLTWRVSEFAVKRLLAHGVQVETTYAPPKNKEKMLFDKYQPSQLYWVMSILFRMQGENRLRAILAQSQRNRYWNAICQHRAPLQYRTIAWAQLTIATSLITTNTYGLANYE